jgi:hypothetical protein
MKNHEDCKKLVKSLIHVDQRIHGNFEKVVTSDFMIGFDFQKYNEMDSTFSFIRKSEVQDVIYTNYNNLTCAALKNPEVQQQTNHHQDPQEMDVENAMPKPRARLTKKQMLARNKNYTLSENTAFKRLNKKLKEDYPLHHERIVISKVEDREDKVTVSCYKCAFQVRIALLPFPALYPFTTHVLKCKK